MEKIKVIFKRIVITYLIFYIVLSSASTCFARGYDEACGEYVSQYAREFIAEYCTPTEEKTVYSTEWRPHWGGGTDFTGTFYACCSTGVWYMYNLALGVDLESFGMSMNCTQAVPQMLESEYFENVTNETLQPGDIVINVHHVEMYVGNNQNANFGNSPYSGKIVGGPRMGEFTHAFRLKSSVDVDPSGTVRASSSSGTNVSYSKFFFNGIPDGKYSLAKRTFWQVIIDSILQVIDFIVNLIFYIIRAVFVGFTAIMENLLSWVVNVVSDTNVEDPSIPISSTEASTSDSDTKITVDKILFNKLELFDINVFSQD